MFTNNKERICSTLKHLRAQRGVTQEKMAEDMWHDARTIRRWENGTVNICPSALAELADYFGVDIEEFFCA